MIIMGVVSFISAIRGSIRRILCPKAHRLVPSLKTPFDEALECAQCRKELGAREAGNCHELSRNNHIWYHGTSVLCTSRRCSPHLPQAGYHCADCWTQGLRTDRCGSCGALQQLSLGSEVARGACKSHNSLGFQWISAAQCVFHFL